jgi:hypothetical protein
MNRYYKFWTLFSPLINYYQLVSSCPWSGAAPCPAPGKVIRGGGECPRSWQKSGHNRFRLHHAFPLETAREVA